MRAPSHRRRFAAGLALALALSVGGSALLLGASRRQLAEETVARREMASLLALSELAARSGGRGEPLRRAVAAWQAAQPPGTSARVVLLSGAALEASTRPEDAGERAAPRRLARDEKAAFDRAQRLRAAVAGNREGGARKPELEVARRADGGLSLAAPLLLGEEPAGMVEIAPPPPAPGAAPPSLPAPLGWALLLGLALPLGGYLLAAGRLGERRWLHAGVAALAVLLGTAIAGGPAMGEAGRACAVAHREVSAHVRAQAEAATRFLAAEGLPGDPLRPGAWDADVSRAPRGFLADDGQLDRRRVASDLARAVGDARGTLLAAFLVGLGALALVGFGGLAQVGRALAIHRQAYAYVAPAIVGTLLLVFFPFLYGIALSFTDQNIYNTSTPLSDLWVGLKNYSTILGDFGLARRAADGTLAWNYLNFYWTFLFTVIWTATNVAFGVSFGLLLALALNTKALALRPVYRVLLIVPWAMPNYITALIWKGMFHRQFGVVNQALAILGVEPISWFDSPFTSFLTAFATNGWLSFPFMMVVSLGALQSIPADIYEAARVDGASRWQQFRAITLPSLKPALVPAVILSVVWTFNMFNIIYLVTAGAPNGATEILVTQAYKFAFERYRYGYAAAYATIIFGILLVYGTIQNRVTRATEAL